MFKNMLAELNVCLKRPSSARMRPTSIEDKDGLWKKTTEVMHQTVEKVNLCSDIIS